MGEWVTYVQRVRKVAAQHGIADRTVLATHFVNGVLTIGGSFDDVAKLTVYVVDWSPDKLPLLGEGVARAAAKLGVDPVKPITLLGVAALGEPDLMVEVEATAVID